MISDIQEIMIFIVSIKSPYIKYIIVMNYKYLPDSYQGKIIDSHLRA